MYNHAKQKLDELIERTERTKTGFDRCNICRVCGYLVKGNCTATKKVRLKKKVNGVMNCEDVYQDIKWWDHILHDPEQIKKREKFTREMSHISVEDMLRPFTI